MGAANDQGEARGGRDGGTPPLAPPPGLQGTLQGLQLEPRTRREIIAVGGGKGGIGKSLLSTNLGVHLAQQGLRTVLIDADLGGANLHTCLGMPTPQRTLSSFIGGQINDLRDVVVPTNFTNLGLISGAQDVLGAANPKYADKLRLLQEVAQLDVDRVIIDLGGGTAFHTIDFFLLADIGLIAVVPEPTSIENAYRFIKAVCYRRLRSLELAWGLPPRVALALDEREGRGLRSPVELLAGLEQQDAPAAARLRQELARFPFNLVVNQVRTPDEAALGPAIAGACRKYFGVSMHFAGAVAFDDAIWQAVRRRRPVLLDSPQSGASGQLRAVAAGLRRQVDP